MYTTWGEKFCNFVQKLWFPYSRKLCHTPLLGDGNPENDINSTNTRHTQWPFGLNVK